MGLLFIFEPEMIFSFQSSSSYNDKNITAYLLRRFVQSLWVILLLASLLSFAVGTLAVFNIGKCDSRRIAKESGEKYRKNFPVGGAYRQVIPEKVLFLFCFPPSFLNRIVKNDNDNKIMAES